MNILVVEDDAGTLKFLETSFKEWGYSVYNAKSAAEAWETFGALPVDIVVSDWMMPEMDGLDLCRRIRDMESERYTDVFDSDIASRKYNAQLRLMKDAEIWFAMSIVYENLADKQATYIIAR